MRWLLLPLLMLFLLPLPLQAQEGNRAGLVVQYENGEIETVCVRFSEPEISGFELLRRSGLPLTYDAQGGSTICSIGGQGCSFPADTCFCQCAGVGSCTYWSYHRLGPDGQWHYSQLGAAAAKVRHGDVDGWRWGAGGPNEAPPPVGVSFEAICTAPEPTAPPTIAATTPPLATATVLPRASATASLTATAAPSPPATGEVTATATEEGIATATKEATATMTVTPSPQSTPVAMEPDEPPLPLNYLIFGILALLLGAGVIVARRG